MKQIIITWKDGRRYTFRPCDTEGMTHKQVQIEADKNGHLQYEPGGVWLIVKGVGYGWEIN